MKRSLALSVIVGISLGSALIFVPLIFVSQQFVSVTNFPREAYPAFKFSNMSSFQEFRVLTQLSERAFGVERAGIGDYSVLTVMIAISLALAFTLSSMFKKKLI